MLSVLSAVPGTHPKPKPCVISPLPLQTLTAQAPCHLAPISPNFNLLNPPVRLIFFLSLNSPASSQRQSTSFSLSLILSRLCLQLICHFLRQPFLYTTFHKRGSALLLYLGLVVFCLSSPLKQKLPEGQCLTSC